MKICEIFFIVVNSYEWSAASFSTGRNSIDAKTKGIHTGNRNILIIPLIRNKKKYMPTVNFYLKKPEELKEGVSPRRKPGSSLIYLQFKYNSKKFVYTFSHTIDPDDWNAGKQRVKNNKRTLRNGDYLLNDT